MKTRQKLKSPPEAGLFFTYIKEKSGLFTEKIPEQFGTGGRAQFSNSLILDLADTFAGQTETLSNILQTHGMVDAQSEEQTEYFFLPVGQRTQGPFDLCFKRSIHRQFIGEIGRAHV